MEEKKTLQTWKFHW